MSERQAIALENLGFSKDDKWRMKLLDYLMIIGIIIIILVGIFVLIYMKNQMGMCIDNPIGYYETTKNTTCWCVNDYIW